MNKIDLAIERLSIVNIFSGFKETSEILIRKSEIYLNIKFPGSYKNFLLKIGYLGIFGFELYGIIDENFEYSSIPDGIWLHKKKCLEFNHPIHIFTISDIGDGSSYALDLSQMNSEEECPVVIWPVGGYVETPVLEIVAPDFGTWFLEMVEEQIRIKQDS